MKYASFVDGKSLMPLSAAYTLILPVSNWVYSVLADFGVNLFAEGFCTKLSLKISFESAISSRLSRKRSGSLHYDGLEALGTSLSLTKANSFSALKSSPVVTMLEYGRSEPFETCFIATAFLTVSMTEFESYHS